ncbi:TPA: hypothetical protein HA241_02830 [Candidatus Woesearchaeota archaeon]|nr:hypothetical protein [Candidatus Woesearchaeota archaeon]
MSIINFHQGCGLTPGCFGPHNPYYTIFTTPLFIIHYPLLFAIIPTVIALSIFIVLKKKTIIDWSSFTIILLVILIYSLSFTFFAHWTWIVY